MRGIMNDFALTEVQELSFSSVILSSKSQSGKLRAIVRNANVQ